MSTPSLTYGQLEYLLKELGYHLNQVQSGPRVWENPSFDAVKLLPEESPDKPARLHHLLTVRKVSVEKGIVDEATFAALLEKAQRHDIHPAPNRDAA